MTSFEHFFVKPEFPLLTCQVQSKEPEFKNHNLNDTLFFCFVKLCNGFNLSSGRVGHLEALTWSCLFPPYNWNISRSIRPHFQFHSPFSGNTILSTQLTSHWCKTHGKAAALKKDSYNFSAAEKEQGLVKDDNFYQNSRRPWFIAFFQQNVSRTSKPPALKSLLRPVVTPAILERGSAKIGHLFRILIVSRFRTADKFLPLPCLKWTGQAPSRFCSHYHCCSRAPISESIQTGFFV